MVTKQTYWEKVSGGLDWGREEWRKEIPEQVLDDSFCGRKQGEEETHLEGRENKSNVDIIPDEYLNTFLTKTDKDNLCKILNLKDSSRRTLKWTGVKQVLEKEQYIIETKTKTINGKRVRGDVISKGENFTP